MNLRFVLILIALFYVSKDSFSQSFGMYYSAQRKMDQRFKEKYQRALETGKGLRFIHSMDNTIGISLPHRGKYNFVDGAYSTHPSIPDSIIKQDFTINSRPSLTVSSLCQFDFIKIDRTNAVAFVWGINCNINLEAKFIDELCVLKGQNNATINQTRVMSSIPIGFSYKTGGFVSHDKADKLSFAIGATLAPTFLFNSLEGHFPLYYSKSKLYIQPYYFAEIGFFAAVKWKVRLGVYSIGYQPINTRIEGGGMLIHDQHLFREITYRSSGPLFQLTLGTMTGSENWENSRW